MNVLIATETYVGLLTTSLSNCIRGTGFFHCLRETEAPSTSPSSSGFPTSLPSTSMSPTACYDVGITIKYNDNPRIFTWTLFKMNDYGVWEGILFKDDYGQPSPNSVVTHTTCLVANTYEFNFYDDSGDWTFFTGSYSITVNGREIAYRSEFSDFDFVIFDVGPPEPSSSPLASPLQVTVLSQEEAPAISVAIVNQSTSSSTENNEDSVTVSESKDPVVEPFANPNEDTPAPVPFD